MPRRCGVVCVGVRCKWDVGSARSERTQAVDDVTFGALPIANVEVPSLEFVDGFTETVDVVPGCEHATPQCDCV